MHRTYVVTGTLIDGHTLHLDEELPLQSAKVRVVVEPLETAAQPSWQEVMAKIREWQRLRGHQPPTREEVDTYIRTEREGWHEW